ncbi:U-megalopygitoxin(1)-Mo1-like [Aphomia sociella]
MFKLFVIVCWVAVQISCGVKSFQHPIEKPAEFADKEGCYVQNLNMVLPYNEKYSPKDGKTCMEYVCSYNNITTINTCGVIKLSKGWEKFDGDLTKPYPECCDFAEFTADDADH